jgi:hypothetical protein
MYVCVYACRENFVGRRRAGVRSFVCVRACMYVCMYVENILLDKEQVCVYVCMYVCMYVENIL